MLFGLQLFTSLADPSAPGAQLFETTFHGHEVSCQWTNDLHGDRSCAVSVVPSLGVAMPDRLHLPDDAFRLHGHAEIHYGGRLIFEGRVAGPQTIKHGRIVGFDIEGYQRALQSRIHLSTLEQTYYTGELLQLMVSSLVPGVTTGDLRRWVETGAQVTPAEYHQSNTASLAEAAARLGDGNGVPVRWAVLPGREFTLIPVYIPDVFEYEVALNYDDDDRPHLPVITSHQRNAANIVTAAAVKFERSDTGTVVTYPAHELELASNPWGVMPSGYVREVVLQGGRLTQSAAYQFLTTYLRMHSVPSVEVSIACGPDAPLSRPSGEQVPAWLARAGEWCMVGGDGPLLITEVSCRSGLGAGTTILQAISPEALFDSPDPLRYAMQVARHNEARINSVTRTRDRT